MEKKIRFGFSVKLLVCVILGIIGIVYFAAGLSALIMGGDGEAHTVGLIFTLLGGAFLAVTAVLLYMELKFRKHIRQAVEEHRCIWGEITEIDRNYSVRINGRCPYVVLVRYVDRNGQLHLFRSRNLMRYPDKSIIGKQVRVYYKDEAFKVCYVDLDGVLPDVKVH